MNPSSRHRIAHLVLAAFQFCAALALLYWALPLFFDPPILGNGIDRATYELKTLAEHAENSTRLVAAVRILGWMFARHSEGVLAAIASALVLGASALVTVLLASPTREP